MARTRACAEGNRTERTLNSNRPTASEGLYTDTPMFRLTWRAVSSSAIAERVMISDVHESHGNSSIRFTVLGGFLGGTRFGRANPVGVAGLRRMRAARPGVRPLGWW